MNIPDHIRQRAMSAINSKETTAMLKHAPKPATPSMAQQIMTGATTGLKTVVAEVGWQQLAGAAALYYNYIRQQEKQKGTTPPQHHKNHNRHIGRDYEY